jgi:hypothetical protein
VLQKLKVELVQTLSTSNFIFGPRGQFNTFSNSLKVNRTSTLEAQVLDRVLMKCWLSVDFQSVGKGVESGTHI